MWTQDFKQIDIFKIPDIVHFDIGLNLSRKSVGILTKKVDHKPDFVTAVADPYHLSVLYIAT